MTVVRVNELAAAYHQRGAPAVIDSLIAEAGSTGGRPEEHIMVVMSLLEELAEHRLDIACFGMLSLWPIASELMMHDVCDAVDLWIVHSRSAAVTTYLNDMIASETNADFKRHLRGLLDSETA